MRPGLPSATIGGVAGYPFAYPVTVGVVIAVVMLLAAVIAWAGGSMVWEGALLMTVAPAAWRSIGVVVSARSGLLRRVDDPAHLETLGRVDAALTGLHELALGAPVLASSVEEFWWAAAASPRSALVCAEELEALLNSRTSQRARSSGGLARTVTEAPQPDHTDLQDRFYRVAEQHRLYETDIEQVLTAPQLGDLRHPATRAFMTSLLTAQDVLQRLEVGAATTDDPQDAVHELEVRWRAAEESAALARLSGFAPDEQAALERTTDLIHQALHNSSSAVERRNCYRAATQLLDGLIGMPDQTNRLTPYARCEI